MSELEKVNQTSIQNENQKPLESLPLVNGYYHWQGEGRKMREPEVFVRDEALTQMLDTYNQYSDETREQWENNLKVMYENRLLKMSVKGIEDMGMMNSYRRVRLEKHPSGNFLFIDKARNSEEEGYIFPVPWLRFNNTTLTDQLKPFYNLPDHASEGIIEGG